MIACLRSTRFMMPDGSASVFLDLRRLMDLDAMARGRKTRQFVVTRRLGHQVDGIKVIMNKSFDELPEARAYWCEQAMKYEDKGMQRLDIHIAGFHEED